MKLLTILKDILSALKTLQDRKNLYYYKAVTVASQYGKTITLCSLTLPTTGIYLILGGVNSSISSTNINVADITVGTNCSRLLGAIGRSTMNSGGGTHAWALVEVTEANGVVNLTSYGCVNSTYNLRGQLIAIKLAR